MWIRIVDVTQNRVVLNTNQIVGIIMPSPLTPGDGKCRVVATGIMIEVSLSEASRLAKLLTESVLDTAMRES